jgi:hypothetical protein
MKRLKIPGRRKPVYVAEWKDVGHIVERVIKSEHKFLARMANL